MREAHDGVPAEALRISQYDALFVALYDCPDTLPGKAIPGHISAAWSAFALLPLVIGFRKTYDGISLHWSAVAIRTQASSSRW